MDLYFIQMSNFILQSAKNYIQKKELKTPIPISCFTATAKPKVVSDIRQYFLQGLGLDLELFATGAARENLRYQVLFKEDDEQKYATLRLLLQEKDCPSIIYASRVKRTEELARRLRMDGFSARHYHGQMDAKEKAAAQEAFKEDRTQIIVATSAFGMGVDKSNVGLVVHYTISDSLENYMQEAGRAGRDPSLLADCYILFNQEDLDNHFHLLNQTRLSLGEIQNIWTAVKGFGAKRALFQCSALELAREAGWGFEVLDVETKVRAALCALENAGYLRRGYNYPKVYATALLTPNMIEGSAAIEGGSMAAEDKQDARRLLSHLLSAKNQRAADGGEPESRVDYLADLLGLSRPRILHLISCLREQGLLADDQDMRAHLPAHSLARSASPLLDQHIRLEDFLLNQLLTAHTDEPENQRAMPYAYKEWNQLALDKGFNHSSIKRLRNILYFWEAQKYIRREEESAGERGRLHFLLSPEEILAKQKRRQGVARSIMEYFIQAQKEKGTGEENILHFSLLGLWRHLQANQGGQDIVRREVEESLFYLSKIGALPLEGGFFVLYQGMEIQRLVLDNRIRYKQEDYQILKEYYQQKMQQIHIVGEYAHWMARDYAKAQAFVADYFHLDWQVFLKKYFEGDKAQDLERSMTASRYQALFGQLNTVQEAIIHDKDSQYILAAAGPGSGKTRVLVHKLASLLCMEEVKSHQLLMLTFSRGAADAFKSRLADLIGKPAYYVDIKTFHSFAFSLLGKVGNLQQSQDILPQATELIRQGLAEPVQITKSVLVIDEAQDMSAQDFALVRALMETNEGMRIIAVGDDDQNIYGFRGADSAHMASLESDYGARRYELLDNYRSQPGILQLSNAYARSLSHRLKSRDILCRSELEGEVECHVYSHRQLCLPLARHLSGLWRERGRQLGSVAVLTHTNEEALQLYALLDGQGLSVRLLQSGQRLLMRDFPEVQHFLRLLDRRNPQPQICRQIWEECMSDMGQQYRTSHCLPTIQSMLNSFLSLHPQAYKQDLREYCQEFDYYDFVAQEQGEILISTIHKAKGKEFDTVFLLHCWPPRDDEDRRKIYVALTRAKQNLYLHCSDKDLLPFLPPEASVRRQSAPPREADSLLIQMGHRDIYLKSLQYRQVQYAQMYSGQPLICEREGLSFVHQGQTLSLLQFSRAFQQKWQTYLQQGYHPVKAHIEFLVLWYNRDMDAQWLLPLPRIWFSRQ